MSEAVQLYHGDALEVLESLPDVSVDFIFTDPPYGHSNNSGKDLIGNWERAYSRGPKGGDLIGNRERALGRVPKGRRPPPTRPIANDGLEANVLFRKFLPHAVRLLRNDCCCCCCCGGGGPDPQFARWSLQMNKLMNFKQMIVWDKGKMGIGWHYRRSYETVLVAQKGKGKCHWYDTSDKIENIIRPGDYGIRKIIPSASEHPTEKPSELAAHFLKLHTQPGDVVLDPFMGSGSTGIACLKTGRRFIGIELDPHWYAVAERRLRKQATIRTVEQIRLPPRKIVTFGVNKVSKYKPTNGEQKA